MPDVRALIESAQVRGLKVFLAEGKVKVKAPHSLDGDTQAFIEELREHKEEIKAVLGQDDPILSPGQWYPHFRDFHHKVIAETPNFDYLWLKEHGPDLYRDIKAKENALDALGDARLSTVVALMRQWRELVLKAEFELVEASKPQQGDLKLRAG
ncbi:MAG: hypothetical protein IH856_01655 [Deltaproteobacteria bacterium]|nr:hypothetical protein [Deltaproteobacteria bacterium]